HQGRPAGRQPPVGLNTVERNSFRCAAPWERTAGVALEGKQDGIPFSMVPAWELNGMNSVLRSVTRGLPSLRDLRRKPSEGGRGVPHGRNPCEDRMSHSLRTTCPPPSRLAPFSPRAQGQRPGRSSLPPGGDSTVPGPCDTREGTPRTSTE